MSNTVEAGIEYSVIPSVLPLFGFCFTQCWKFVFHAWFSKLPISCIHREKIKKDAYVFDMLRLCNGWIDDICFTSPLPDILPSNWLWHYQAWGMCDFVFNGFSFSSQIHWQFIFHLLIAAICKFHIFTEC